MSKQILSITQVNEYIRRMIDGDRLLTGLAVKGEISNYKVYASGHHYFTLKDENSALSCVMYRSRGIRLKFRPENGMKIIAIGHVSVYERNGVYQLICDDLIAEGQGDLAIAFDQLKAKLAAEGLFDSAHKKNFPVYPGTICIITSADGAVFHDILRIIKARYPLTVIKLLPVRVQGQEAPDEIASAIHYANYYHVADVLIIGRGGGSIEDLWAFNDEKVARSIYSSEIPVISAVGHEPDITISDFVADYSAATPTHAAEYVVQDQFALRQKMDALHNSMYLTVQRQIKNARKHLDFLSARPSMQSPVQYIEQRRKNVELLLSRLVSIQEKYLSVSRQRFLESTSKLDAMSPLKVLTRGYAMVQDQNGNVLHSIKQTAVGNKLSVSVNDGILEAAVTSIKENDQ